MSDEAEPAVVAAAGRRIDARDAETERFPLRNRDRVRDDIRAALAARPVALLVSSAACGVDLLALEAAGALGIRRRVVLPFGVTRFRAESVVDRPGDWGPLFDAVIAAVCSRSDLIVLEGRDETAYAEANARVLAEGERFAATTRADKVALIAWDGTAREGRDTTDQFRTEALSRGWTVEELSTI